MGLLFLSGAMSALPAEASAPTVPSIAVTMTAYNAVPEQTDSDPFTTASGAYSNPEIVAARSRDLAEELPFGTIIEIVGVAKENESCGYHVVAPLVGYRVIADTMNARYSDRIDILFSTEDNFRLKDGSVKNAGSILGICDGVSVRVVGHIDGKRPGKFPKTQGELAALVTNEGSTLALK